MSRFKLLRLRRSFIGNSIGRPLIGDGRFCDQLMLPPPPLANALLKAQQGDVVIFNAPNGQQEVEVCSIKYVELT